jgi:hypothetical protein
VASKNLPWVAKSKSLHEESEDDLQDHNNRLTSPGRMGHKYGVWAVFKSKKLRLSDRKVLPMTGKLKLD